MKRHTRDLQIIERIEMAQQNALDELYLASPRLYNEAIKVSINPKLYCTGPLSNLELEE